MKRTQIRSIVFSIFAGAMNFLYWNVLLRPLVVQIIVSFVRKVLVGCSGILAPLWTCEERDFERSCQIVLLQSGFFFLPCAPGKRKLFPNPLLCCKVDENISYLRMSYSKIMRISKQYKKKWALKIYRPGQKPTAWQIAWLPRSVSYRLLQHRRHRQCPWQHPGSRKMLEDEKQCFDKFKRDVSLQGGLMILHIFTQQFLISWNRKSSWQLILALPLLPTLVLPPKKSIRTKIYFWPRSRSQRSL